MSETSTRNRVVRMLVVLGALSLMLGGLYLRSGQISDQAEQTQEEKRKERRAALLADLTDRPLLVTTPTGYRAGSLATVEEYIAAARAANLDLPAIYLDRSHNARRADIAYMLALGRPETYLELVDGRFEDVGQREVILWLHLVDVADHDDRLPAGLAEGLKELLLKAPHPPARWWAARQYYQGGADDAGDRIARELLKSDSPYYAAQAAGQLAKRDAHREEAMDRLWELAGSDDALSRREAARALAKLIGLTDQPAYRAFMVADTPENTAELIRALKEHRDAG
ncbi:MAG: hypothetical protein ACOCZU_08220 [Planctomycetota bacterium]